jgi:hypothetical protein
MGVKESQKGVARLSLVVLDTHRFRTRYQAMHPTPPGTRDDVDAGFLKLAIDTTCPARLLQWHCIET